MNRKAAITWHVSIKAGKQSVAADNSFIESMLRMAQNDGSKM